MHKKIGAAGNADTMLAVNEKLHRKLEMKQACNCKKCGYKRDKKKGDDRSGDGMSVLEGMREMEV